MNVQSMISKKNKANILLDDRFFYIENLWWESNFFSANISQLFFKKLMKKNSFFDLKKFFLNKNIDLLQVLIDHDITKMNYLIENGFKPVDIKQDFVYKIKEEENEVVLNYANEDNIIELKKISKGLFKDSRFNYSKYTKNKVEDFFELWIEKAVMGTFDDSCLIKKENNVISGFVTYKIINDKKMRIGVIGVNKNYFRQGIGTYLLNCLKKICFDKNIEEIIVTTQGKNIGAQNLYIINGFLLKDSKIWFYKEK